MGILLTWVRDYPLQVWALMLTGIALSVLCTVIWDHLNPRKPSNIR